MNRPNLSVAVFGAAGLVGGELLRLLAVHPDVGRIRAFSKSHAGQPVSNAHPAMLHAPEIVFEDGDSRDLPDGIDVCFLALGHGESQTAVSGSLLDGRVLVIDLAADFRIRDRAAYEAVYGPHSCFETVGRFQYGLPELARDAIANSRAIANPGCFATASELLVLPLAMAGLLPPMVAIYAVTGSTGAGVKPKATTHHPFRDGNMFAYKTLSHQHEPEIAQCLSDAAGAPVACRLLAHSGPFVRGIYASTYLSSGAFADLNVAAMYRDFYSTRPFVLVRPEPPQLAHVNGTNFVHVNVAQRGPELQISLALDNLTKGASGQAIQNMNLACGLAETAGLMLTGAFPC